MILLLDLGEPNISESLHCLANILADILHCDKVNSFASSTDEIEDLGEDFIFNSVPFKKRKIVKSRSLYQ